MAVADLGRLKRLSGAGAGATEGLARVAARLHLTVTGVAVVGLVVLGWLSARAIGSRTMYLMSYASMLAVVLAWFVSRRRPAIDVERSELAPRMRVGQIGSVELRLTARRRVSTVVVEEDVPPHLGRTVHIPIGALRPGDEIVHRYAFTPRLRGVYRLGPTMASWSDPFGITTHRQELSEAVEIIVHPRTETVHDRVLTRMWEDPPIRPPVSKPWPVGFEFYGMRDYVPGDDLRRVVWATVAKTGRMMVRESEQGITDRVLIVIDTNAEWHSPGEVSDTFEAAVATAASVGVCHLDEGFAVSLLTNEGRQVDALRGNRASLPYLDELARLQRGNTPLEAIGTTLLQEARWRPHVLVVTPHLGNRDAQQLRLIVERGVSVVVANVVWDETDPAALARAAALGCQVVQVPPNTSLEAVFARQLGGVVRS